MTTVLVAIFAHLFSKASNAVEKKAQEGARTFLHKSLVVNNGTISIKGSQSIMSKIVKKNELLSVVDVEPDGIASG